MKIALWSVESQAPQSQGPEARAPDDRLANGHRGAGIESDRGALRGVLAKTPSILGRPCNRPNDQGKEHRRLEVSSPIRRPILLALIHQRSLAIGATHWR